jgi:hypothetical protein
MEWRLAAARLTLPEKQHKPVINQIDKAFRIATPMRKALSICQPIGFESGRGQPVSGTQVSRVNEHTPAHRRSAWATRGLASDTKLPKRVGTIPTYHSVRQDRRTLASVSGRVK